MPSSKLRGAFFLLAAAACATPALAGLPTIDTTAQNAIVIDFNTGAVLLDKGADERVQPASLSKMMTAYVVFDALKKGQLKLDDTLPVSREAWAKHKTDESNMFVPLGANVKVEDLIRGMIVQSGNDACVVLAEGIAGTTDAFVERMNDMARKFGLKDTHFADVDGLPDPQEYTTPRDLTTIATHLIKDFPEYYHYDAEKEFTYNGIRQGNRNPLLYKDPSVDGLKTGHTEEAGYGVAISALRDGRRIVEVLTGMKSMQERSNESEKLLDWAFRAWEDVRVAKAGETVDEAPVWLGAETRVPAAAASDIFMTLPRGEGRELTVTAVYDAPVRAPVARGETVGKLEVTGPDMKEADYPLVAAAPVARLDALGRVAAAAGYLLWGRH